MLTELRENRQPNELIRVFEQFGFPINSELKKLLTEGNKMVNNRKGCGFIEASKYFFRGGARSFFDIGELESEWFDENDEFPEISDLVDIERVREAVNMLRTEDGKLLGRLILDRICGYEATDQDIVLPISKEKIGVGSCSSAERYYLEFIADPRSYAQAGNENSAMHVIVDDNGQPIALEKEGLGDSYSCLTVREVVMNGKRIPAGTLLAVDYPKDTECELVASENLSYSQQKKNSKKIKLVDCTGFRILRLSTLAISPASRRRVFGEHLDWQADNFFPKHDTTTIEECAAMAEKMAQEPTLETDDEFEDTW